MALSRGVLGRAPALCGAGRRRPGRTDVLGGLGPGLRRDARADLGPGARRPRRGLDGGRGLRGRRSDRLGARRAAPTLVRIEAAAKRETEKVRGFLRVGEGSRVECGVPQLRRGAATSGPEADRRRWSATCGSVSAGSGSRRRGVEDESCGYHPHHTVWDWSAGVGTAIDGRAVGWNLVGGINDPPRGSERAVWAGAELSEPGPVELRGPRSDLARRRAARVHADL